MGQVKHCVREADMGAGGGEGLALHKVACQPLYHSARFCGQAVQPVHMLSVHNMRAYRSTQA